MKGFFEPSAWQGIRQPLPLIAECGKCKLDLGCNSPRMPVSGKGLRKILILAEAPGQTEDERGIQLIGNSGMELVQIMHRLGSNMRKDCWLTNSIQCRPPKNRDPIKKEIDFCRPNLTKSLADLQPDVIIPLGKFAIQSLLPLAWKAEKVDNMAAWAGWKIPCQQLNAWICPTYHPASLLYNKDDQVLRREITKHIQAALEIKGKPWPTGTPDYASTVDVEMNTDKAAEKIERFCGTSDITAIDIETTCLKPDGPTAHILCCSISDGVNTIAYPWSGKAVGATKKFLKSSTPKTVANLRFESRWFHRKLGIFPRFWVHDTLLGAHALKCTHGICSLKFQAFVLHGIKDYDAHIEPYKKSKDQSGNSLNRMHELEPRVLMTYCGLDSLFEVMVTNTQIEQGASL